MKDIEKISDSEYKRRVDSMTDLELAKHFLSPYPGVTLKEHIDYIEMTQEELAEKLDISNQKLEELIQGKTPFTREISDALEELLDIPASFFLNLEKTYQKDLLKIEELEKLEEYSKRAITRVYKAIIPKP